MSELTIRRDREISAARYRAAEKAEKTEKGGGPIQRTEKTPGFTLSETLRQLLSGSSRTESQIRESRRTLQSGEAVLAEVQENLSLPAFRFPPLLSSHLRSAHCTWSEIRDPDHFP